MRRIVSSLVVVYRRAMIRTATALALLTLPLPAMAQTFYVDRAIGSDAGACTTWAAPCFTIQGAYNKCPRFGECRIRIADGIYTEPLNVYYQHVVTITGNCDDPSRVILQANSTQSAIVAQDTVIAIIGCLTLTSTVSGGAALASRQYAIIDYFDIRFGPFPNGMHVALAGKTKANCGGQIEIFGDAAVHAVVADQSLLDVACAVTFAGQRSFIDSFQCVGLSLCSFGGFSYSGPAPAGRMLYIDQSRATGMNRLWGGTITPVNYAVVIP